MTATNALRWHKIEGRKFLHLGDGTKAYPLCLSSLAPLYYAEEVDVAPRARVCDACERVAVRLKLELPPINERDRGAPERDYRTKRLGL